MTGGKELVGRVRWGGGENWTVAGGMVGFGTFSTRKILSQISFESTDVRFYLKSIRKEVEHLDNSKNFHFSKIKNNMLYDH